MPLSRKEIKSSVVTFSKDWELENDNETQLDKAVDLCYHSQPFPSDTERIEFLFDLYDKYTEEYL